MGPKDVGLCPSATTALDETRVMGGFVTHPQRVWVAIGTPRFRMPTDETWRGGLGPETCFCRCGHVGGRRLRVLTLPS